MRTPEHNPEREDLTPHTTPEELLSAVDTSPMDTAKNKLNYPEEKIQHISWDSTLKALTKNIFNLVNAHGNEYIAKPDEKFLGYQETTINNQKVGLSFTIDTSENSLIITLQYLTDKTFKPIRNESVPRAIFLNPEHKIRVVFSLHMSNEKIESYDKNDLEDYLLTISSQLQKQFNESQHAQ